MAKLGTVVLGGLGALLLAVVSFFGLAPQVVKAPQGWHLDSISTSPHFKDGTFVNEVSTTTASFWKAMSTLPEYWRLENGEPKDTLPVRFGLNKELATDSSCFITWYGHSAFFFEIEGKRILIDPMLGDYAAPFSFMANRFPYKEPIPIDDLKEIDVLVLSHDHYDHLDYFTINQLANHVNLFVVPLGVGAHLRHWGVPASRIKELDWWQSTKVEGIELTACPARHFSGRAILDRDATLWASWAIKGSKHNLYFSGDGGYGQHFKEIGKRLGPFDLTFLECGQYNIAWHDIHMLPEESVQAGKDLNAQLAMPIHWGAFQLSVHTWTEPIYRFKGAAQMQSLPLVHPFIGERFCLGKQYPREEWWRTSE